MNNSCFYKIYIILKYILYQYKYNMITRNALFQLFD